MLVSNKRYLSKLLNAVLILFIVLSSCFTFCNTVKAEQEAEINREIIIDEQADSEEVETIQEQLQKHSSEDILKIFEGYDPQSFIKDTAKGNFKFDIKGIFNRVFMFLFKEIYQNIHVLVKLIVLVILCALLKNLQTSFLSESVGELAFYACYIVIVSVMFVSFNSVFKLGFRIIDSMVNFMHATIPVMITLLVSGGNITSGGIFQPVLIMVVEVSATIIKNVFLPVIFLSALLSIADNISDKIQLSKLANLLRQSALWALGFILTVFIAVLTIQGSLGAVVDGVTGKTAKFAINFIPVVGGYLADAADTVVGCTLLIKNAAGLAVMVGVIAICLVPMLKILALIALFKIACVLVEPISEKRITNCINEVANSLTFVLGIVASVTFMFLISITAIISASNLSTMVR